MKRSQNVNYYVAGLVALLTFLVYLVSLRNDFVMWDDNLYIYENPHIRSLNPEFFRWSFFDFYASNWHPLTWLSHALDYALWGLNPVGHHLTNIILHAVNTYVVVLLTVSVLQAGKRLTPGSDGAGFPAERAILIAAGITGLLFGLHPLHVESVAWVSERKDLLCALFFLLAVVMYLKCAGAREQQAAHQEMQPFAFRKYYLLSCGFFVLALLSKPMAVTLPVVLLILDWYPFERIQSFQALRQAVVEKAPFFALSLVSSVITIVAQRAGGALRLTEIVPLPARVLVGAKSLVLYLWKTLWPLDLVPYYPYPEHLSALSFEYLAAVALVSGITAACIVVARKQKLWLAVWGIYVVTLLPVIGIIQVGEQSMADRYMYLPSLGPLMVLGLTASWIWAKVNGLQRRRLVTKASAAGVAVIIVAALSLTTWRQIGVWKNSVDLWSDVIRKEPQKVPLAYNNRGLTYWKSGLLKEAIEDFDMAITLDPSYTLAYNNRGVVLSAMGQYDAAIRDYNTAIALDPSNYEPYINRGTLFGKLGLYARAIEDYNKVIELEHGDYHAYNNLGIFYSKIGLLDKASETFNKAIAIKPNEAELFNNRGFVYSLEGHGDRALEDYNKAIELKPDFITAYKNRGSLYQKNGRKDLALADFRKACALGDEFSCNALR